MGDFVGHNVKGANQVVLKEIMEFAEYLGMDPVEDGDLLWIAEQARNAPLPAPWSEHQDEAGNTYYYNSATVCSVSLHPNSLGHLLTGTVSNSCRRLLTS